MEKQIKSYSAGDTTSYKIDFIPRSHFNLNISVGGATGRFPAQCDQKHQNFEKNTKKYLGVRRLNWRHLRIFAVLRSHDRPNHVTV